MTGAEEAVVVIRSRLPMAVVVAGGAILLLPLSILAFWPMYLARPFAEIDGYTHLHAAAGLTWLLMLVAQAQAIRIGQRGFHRAAGRLSYVLAPAFALSGLLLAHFRFSRMDAAVFAGEAYTLYLPLSAFALFSAAYALAIAYRRNTRLHARFMACTALPLIDPVIGRVMAFYLPGLPQLWHYQVVTFGAASLLAGLLLRSLRPGSAERRVFLRFAVAFTAVLGLWFVAPYTTPWLALATWFRGLPLT